MKRIYLSGPMTGMPGLNFPAFHDEADRLRSLGYDVVNPAELNLDPNASWHDCMRRDLAELLTCDAIALLDGWQGSSGAHLEMHVAHRVGMQIVVAREIVGEVTAAPAPDAQLAERVSCNRNSTPECFVEADASMAEFLDDLAQGRTAIVAGGAEGCAS